MESNNKKKIVKYLLERNVLVSPELITSLQGNEDPEEVYSKLSQKKEIQEAKVQEEILPNPIRISFEYEDVQKKREIQDFVKFFNARYMQMSGFLRQREEMKGSSLCIGSRRVNLRVQGSSVRRSNCS